MLDAKGSLVEEFLVPSVSDYTADEEDIAGWLKDDEDPREQARSLAISVIQHRQCLVATMYMTARGAAMAGAELQDALGGLHGQHDLAIAEMRRTNIERFLTDRMKTRLKAEMADSKTRRERDASRQLLHHETDKIVRDETKTTSKLSQVVKSTAGTAAKSRAGLKRGYKGEEKSHFKWEPPNKKYRSERSKTEYRPRGGGGGRRSPSDRRNAMTKYKGGKGDAKGKTAKSGGARQ